MSRVTNHRILHFVNINYLCVMVHFFKICMFNMPYLFSRYSGIPISQTWGQLIKHFTSVIFKCSYSFRA